MMFVAACNFQCVASDEEDEGSHAPVNRVLRGYRATFDSHARERLGEGNGHSNAD